MPRLMEFLLHNEAFLTFLVIGFGGALLFYVVHLIGESAARAGRQRALDEHEEIRAELREELRMIREDHVLTDELLQDMRAWEEGR